MLSTRLAVNISMLDFSDRYANTQLINFFRHRFTFDPDSPSGLSNRIHVRKNSQIGKPVGEKHPSGWRVKIKGKTYPIAHIVLILHGSFPEPGQVARHGRYGRFDNRLKNIYWGLPAHADLRSSR